ncbi:MAG: hypothetical protein ACI9LM_002611 [Alteromonadaceae bacterium]|jgi:hypothetical protein
MYFRLSKGFALLGVLALGGIVSSSVSSAELAIVPQQLIAQPALCVALDQGRKCFTKVTLTWTAVTVGDFCLYQKNPRRKIKCWQQSKGNHTLLEFESSEKLTFQLIDHKNNSVAETFIDVSWVHKATPRKRRWRLF